MTAAAIRPLATTRLPGSSVALVNARPARDEPHGASRDGPFPGTGGAGHAGHPDRAGRLRREARILLAVLDETR